VYALSNCVHARSSHFRAQSAIAYTGTEAGVSWDLIIIMEKSTGIQSSNDSDRRLFFLSYTSHESEVSELKKILDPFLRNISEQTWKMAGIWYDAVDMQKEHTSLRPDNQIREELESGLRKSDFTLAMISPYYLRREWCHFEWTSSLNMHCCPTILPVCWKKTCYFKHFATWTEPYSMRQQWQIVYGREPKEAAIDLTNIVIRHILLHRPVLQFGLQNS